MESVAALPWNQWQLSCGIGGRLAMESVAAFVWNRWHLCRGIRNEGKASGEVSHGKVAHPAPQNRIDQVDHPIHRLGLVAPKYVLQLAQERRPLLPHRRVPRTPDASATLDAPKVKAQEAEGF